MENKQTLELTETEKSDIFTYLFEEIFDRTGEDDYHYIDPPMAKLLAYLDVKLPQEITITSHPDEKTHTIKLLVGEA